MRDSIKKILQILNKREHLQLLLLLFLIIITAFAQTLGVASVLPFIGLIMEPALIFENEYLLWAYETFNFADVSTFIIFAGLVMLAIILFSNALSALTTWLETRFPLLNNHRLSMRLLKKYLSMPYAYFLNQNSADLSKNVLWEVNHLTYSYIMPFLQLITQSLVVLFLVGMLILVEPVVSVLAMALIGGPYAVIYFSLRKKLGERGLRLSGGQRQRIGIARALYHDPETLIFDEATSALDGITEKTVLAAMESAARLKTLIIIAHRLSTVENCDLVYLIDRGRIVAAGTYSELLKTNEQIRAMAKANI